MKSEKAREGARMLAAAVILCDKPGIQVPDKTHERNGVQADAILPEWNPRDIQTLLERAIFNDVIYGSVRFRHREIREFLAAEWFIMLLEKGTARYAIEALIFREQYGEDIISPRLRPILPWLILKDRNIRNRALAMHPEIAVEGGDPGRLPLTERQTILNDILDGIVGTGKRTAQDNNAIVRIAQLDLADEALSLIDRHGHHDDAIFFLGRLVWQGKMQKCVPPLLNISIDPRRDIYARIAAIRAVMSCGTDEQRSSLWKTILSDQADIPRELLAELLRDSVADENSTALLLKSINKLPPYKRFQATGLRQALHEFIDRLSISNTDARQPLAMLVDGLEEFLDRPPHDEQIYCRISQEFSWLLNPAVHAVERLVAERADAAMQNSALNILLNSPAVRDSFGVSYDEYKDNLYELVPAWLELNDTLFWQRVEIKRACLDKNGKRMTNFLDVHWPDHYWSFDPDSFPRVLGWLKSCDLEDDRMIALTLGFQIFLNAGKPENLLDQLHTAVKDDTFLVAQLDKLLNPIITKQERKWQEQDRQRRQKHKRRRLEEEKNRLEWINHLKANPDIILHPPGLSAGEISVDHSYLMWEIEDSAVRTNRSKASNWDILIDDFGTEVAHAYRDAAMNHWRIYLPKLPSEGANTSSIPDTITFAMAGLEIEAREHKDFPAHLSESEIHHALRYIIWKISGFPSLLETMFRTNPKAVIGVIQTEMHWVLNNTTPNQTSNRLLHDLTHYAPWLHHELMGPLQSWLRENDLGCQATLSYILHMLKSGGMDPIELGTLAQNKVATSQFHEILPFWFAMWVDAQPGTGISALSIWLSELDADQGSHAAQVFITALMGNLHGATTGPNIGNFQTSEHLKSLYVLMHTYIRAEEDINRAGTGTFSPKLRDEAQDARGRLFNLLSEIPGKATHIALTELTEDHPNSKYRSRMEELAYMRAEQDGDLEPWTETQVHEFDTRLTRTPATQRQLFDLTVDRLTDMKSRIEHGDTSPYATWQLVQIESEMRILVADQLVRDADYRFTISQEDEVANRQRMDIRMHNQQSGHPIPIELKLLDKWSGPKLCRAASKSACRRLSARWK